MAFAVGDMVEYENNGVSTGFVSGIPDFDGFSMITFVSGDNAGKTYNVNNAALRLLSAEKEETVVEVKEDPKPVEKPASTSKKKWSKTEVVAMIKEKPGAVERGILCLNKHNQRIPEKSRSYVSYWAEYIMKGKALSGRHLFNARRTCFFNAKVLVDVANGVI